MHKRDAWWWTRATLLMGGVVSVVSGCPSARDVGSLAAPCFEDGTCRPGLECWRGICLDELGELDGGASIDVGDAGTEIDAMLSADALPSVDVSVADVTRRDGGPPPDAGESSGPIDPSPPRDIHRVAAGPFDVALDWERHRIYFSRGRGGIEVLDLVDGSLVTIPVATDQRAEHLFFDPHRDEIVVTLPIREHSSYWWVTEQTGFVAVVDAHTLELSTPISIAMDPWDVVSDGMGRAYVMGASGQWTSIATIDLSAGSSTLSGLVYESSNIEIHPRRDHAYSADTGLSPSDIQRIELGAVAARPYDSPYHGDYPMCGAVRLHPRGDTIHTRCGHVFLATDSPVSDMTWTGSLGFAWTDLAFERASDRMYVIREGSTGAVDVYDSAALSRLGTISFSHAPQRVLVAWDYLVVVTQVMGGAPAAEVEIRDLSTL